VRAPAGGRVLRVYQENEGPVAAGTPLLEIGDPAALEVVVDLLTADAVRVRPGAAAELDGFGGAAPLRGVVRLVEPSAFTKISALGIEEQRVLVVIDPAGDAAGWSVLGDGYRVDARILVWEAPAVLRVPAGALFRDREDWSAFVLVDGRARLRRIRIDHRAEGEVEVVDGLREGERVILHPSDRVSDGAEVEAD
jgi:HlyD family secretion protein